VVVVVVVLKITSGTPGDDGMTPSLPLDTMVAVDADTVITLELFV
jgi:hypothetical protein